MPWPSAGASVERGKNSYHALKRARSGSTSTSTGRASSAAGSRMPVRQNSASRSMPSVRRPAPARRRRGPGCGRRRGAARPRSGQVPEQAGVAGVEPPAQVGEGGGVGAACSGWAGGGVDQAEPICRSTVTSTPAASLSSMPWRHVPRWSSQPTTWYCQRPSAVGDERGREAVVAERLHRDLPPALAPDADAQGGGGAVVTVGEHVGQHGDRLADGRLGREGARRRRAGRRLRRRRGSAERPAGRWGRGRHRWEP